MTGRAWIDAFAARLELGPLDDETVDLLLALAAVAAHQSERIAAPIACYLAGRAGVDPARAGELAAAIHPSEE